MRGQQVLRPERACDGDEHALDMAEQRALGLHAARCQWVPVVWVHRTRRRRRQPQRDLRPGPGYGCVDAGESAGASVIKRLVCALACGWSVVCLLWAAAVWVCALLVRNWHDNVMYPKYSKYSYRDTVRVFEK
jgi:hypothetical protein